MPRKAKRNAFGSIKARNNAHGVVYQARYKTPIEMFSKYPGINKEHYRTFADETQAHGWLAAEKRKIDAGVWEPPSSVAKREAAKSVTFRQYATDWVAHRCKSNGYPIEGSTKTKYMEKLENHLFKTFGDKPVVAIRPVDVQKWWNSFGTDRLQVHSDSYTLLVSIMHTAEREPINDEGETLIERSPCRLRGTTVRKKHKTVTAELSEVKTVYDAMPDRLKLSIYLAGVMGLRLGEILALRRENIDLNTMTLHVVAAVKPDIRDGKQVIVRGKPKSESSERSLEIPAALKPIIANHLKRFTGKSKTALLFESPRTGGLMRENVFSYYWRQARATVPRLQNGKMKFHDLRHTALQRQVENGATLNMVMAVAGHSDVKVAGKYQDGVTQSFSHQITDKVSRQLAEVISMDEGPTHSDSSHKPDAESGTVQSGQMMDDDEIKTLAGALGKMSLSVRIQVLKNLDEPKRLRVLTYFDPAIQTETMTQLLSDAK